MIFLLENDFSRNSVKKSGLHFPLQNPSDSISKRDQEEFPKTSRGVKYLQGSGSWGIQPIPGGFGGRKSRPGAEHPAQEGRFGGSPGQWDRMQPWSRWDERGTASP